MQEALPLAGLRVLDLSRALAGPFCAMILADLGADVIKIEPTPEGEMVRGWGPFKDGISVYYLSIHRNKRSLAVNFRDPSGLDLMRTLADKADILVENFKPGAMADMKMEDWITHPDYKDNAGRSRNREAVKERLNRVFATRGKMEWTLDLVKLGLPAGPIFTLDQVFSDRHVIETGIVEEIEHPTLGMLRLIANPIRMSGLGGRSVRSAPPALGADSRRVLEDFGIPASEIDAFVASRTIGCS